MSDNATVNSPSPGFETLGLPQFLLDALTEVGYEAASPIQARTIPPLLEGRDIVGQAQTGTGKTAAFALPMLARIDLELTKPQVLVLTPTRELAIQVAESFQRYAHTMPGFHVLPIYGGQAYSLQLRPLRRGVHVVVGTPGRVTDHIRRGTLDLSELKGVVLDEADEMLHMGFIDDVTWILDKTPKSRQIALFSATMPDVIRRVAKTYLREPEEILIREHHATANLIRQRYQVVSGPRKLEALTRILEVEEFDGMLVFVRTRHSTAILAEKLEARGYAAAPLSGDVAQIQRERTIDRLKKGQLDIVVATDVAARGLDVERISHVINFDVPTDTEAYVHRIGRTGRAGRTGDAILFVSPREKRMLRSIERVVRRDLEPMKLPSTADVNRTRVARFKRRIVEAMADPQLDFFTGVVREVLAENEDADPERVAAALARMAQGDQPLLLEERRQEPEEGFGGNFGGPDRPDRPGDRKFGRPDGPRDRPGQRGPKPQGGAMGQATEHGMVRYRVEVGNDHGVRPGSIVGAIANEAGLEGRYIGRIEIHDDFSTVDLPGGMPEDVFRALGRARVCQRMLRISPVRADGKPPRRSKKGKLDK
ncbi:MAG: ATP-dependent RNA helicase DeaD [Chlamydiales bacterium]|jgi:ATP-dependent RNA helicase DeaD